MPPKSGKSKEGGQSSSAAASAAAKEARRLSKMPIRRSATNIQPPSYPTDLNRPPFPTDLTPPPFPTDLTPPPFPIQAEAVDSVVSRNARSIRLTSEDNKTRGVVSGLGVAAMKSALRERITVEKAPHTGTPAYPHVKSLLVHEIGSCIRSKVSMEAAQFKDLIPGVEDILYAHLSPNFMIECTNDWLWAYIMNKANKIYIDWKYKCKKHWETYGDEVPKEFLGRPDEWRWLINHFTEPKQQAVSERMKAARHSANHIDHRSGKLTLDHRAYKIASKSPHVAPHVAAYEEAYSHHPIGAENARRMNERVREVVNEIGLGENDELATLPLDRQVDIISEVVPQKRGTRISGVGDSIRRPPLHRGGANYYTLQDEETRKAREEAAVAREEAAVATQRADEALSQLALWTERIRRMEDHFMGGSPGAGSSNAQDRANLP